MCIHGTDVVALMAPPMEVRADIECDAEIAQSIGEVGSAHTGRVGMPVAYGLTPLGYALLDALSSFERWSRGHMAIVRATRAAFDARQSAHPRHFNSSVRAGE